MGTIRTHHANAHPLNPYASHVARHKPRRLLRLLLCGSLILNPAITRAQPPAATQLPTGEQVVGGQASITRQNSTMNITQGSQRAAIDWQSFDIGRQAQVNFLQPSASSVALNRVQGGSPSQIFGQLNANGQIFLSNPSGIVFAPGASIDVGGLAATTHSMSVDDFMAGKNTLTRNGATGRILNEGTLQAALGGYIALLAPEVRNDGVIIAELGTVALAAGEAYELTFARERSLTGIRIDPTELQTVVDNKHAIVAPGGLIILSAHAANQLHGSVVRHNGVLNASSLVNQGGRIMLEGDDITLTASSSITATGATGGGDVLVGGDWQGSGDLHQATTVTMEEGASINASATNNGDGGKIVLWSDIKNKDSATSVAGTLTARGGVNGGDGGAIETSGSKINTANVAVNAGADEGTGGLWLIDPFSYIIDATAAGNIADTLNTGTSVTVTTTVNDPTFGGQAGGGTVRVESAITKTSGDDATLTLKSDRNMEIEDSITSTDGKLNLVLWANQDDAGQGSVAFENNDSGVASIDITTNGGHLWIGGGSGSTTWNGLTVGDGAALTTEGGTFQSGIQFLNVATNISTGDGSIYMAGTTDKLIFQDIRFGISNATTIDAGSGSIELVGDNIGFANDSTLETTGELILRPFGTSFVDGSNVATAFTWDGTRVGSNLDGAASLNGLIINNVDSLGGLTLGKDGTTSEIIINADTDIAGDVSVYAGTIDVFGDLTAAGDILLDADTGSQLAYNGIGVAIGDATVSTTTASNGSITIEGRGGNDGTAQQGVSLAANSQVTAGGTGDVTITGFGGDESSKGNHHGILLLDNKGITAGGDIVLSGNGGGTVGANGNNDGVRLEGGKIGSDSSGSVTINGTTNADGSNVQDILIFGLGSEIRTGAGNDILLRGDSFGLGDNASGTQSTTIGNSTSTIGTLTFESVSDSFVDTGFSLPELTLENLGGLTLGKDGNTSKIIINPDTNVTGDVSVYAGTIDVRGDLTAAGDILLDADTGSQLTYDGVGVTIGDATVSTTAASNGSITIEGRGGNVGTTAKQGVFLNANSQITAGGSGDVTITGFGGLQSGSNNHGIRILDNSGIDAGGDIVLSGNGGGLVGGGGNHDGVRLEGGKIGSDSSGSVTINGTTNGLGSSVQDILIFGAGSEIRTGAGNDILLRGDLFDLSDNSSPSQSTMIGNSTSTIGTLTFESVSDSFVDTGFTLPELTLENLGGLVVGKSTNTANVMIDPVLDLGGSVDIHGGDIQSFENWDVAGTVNINGDEITTAGIWNVGGAVNVIGDEITTAGIWNVGGAVNVIGDGETFLVGGPINTTGDNVLLKNTGDIEVVANASLTTLGGDITFWSDSDNNGNGYIHLEDNVTLNSETVGGTSGGGNITLAGGLDSNADGRPDGFASSEFASGVTFGLHDPDETVSTNTTTIASGGGDVVIRGKGLANVTTAAHNYGVETLGLLEVDSGTGSIAIVGESADNTAVFFSQKKESGTALDLKSAATSGDAIAITGTATGSSGVGVSFTHDTSTDADSEKSLQATGGGDITITGTGVGSDYGIDMRNTDVLASTGDISFIGTGERIYLLGSTIGEKTGTDVVNSTSDIVLKSSKDVVLTESTTLQTGGGDITLWSDSNANDDGRIFQGDTSVLDSRTAADRTAGTHTSGGGDITLSGGSDLTTGYAQGNSDDGVSVEGQLYSGGGDILVRGKSNTGGSADHGVVMLNGTELLSGVGSISVTGQSDSGNGIRLSNAGNGTITLSSSKASGDAIVIDAQSSGAYGLYFNQSSTKKELSATGGGDIRITGDTTAAGSFGIYASYTQLLAASGTITLDAGSSGLTGGGGSLETDLVFGAEAGSSVTASSSDVNIISDEFNTANGFGFEQFVDTTGHLTIAPSSTAFDSTVHGAEFVLNGSLAADTFTGSDDVATVRIRNYSTLGGLTVGKQDSTSNIAINSAQTINGDINLLGGDISLNAALTAGGANTISLTSSGNITDGVSGFVVADHLALLGGNVTLDHASNNVTTLAASGVGNVTYSDSNALTIGVVDTNSGIAATGAIDVSTLSDNLTTTELVSGSSVILNAAKNTAAGTATGGNLLFSGSSNVTASSGNALLYSGSIAGSTGLTNLIGSGSGNFRYNSDEAATNYSAALGASGNYAIYREQPSVTVTASNNTVTYGTAPTLASSLGGAQNGDTSGQIFSTAPSIAVGGSTSSSGNYTAGSHSLTASGAVDQLGYAIGGYTTGTLTVNKKTITTTLSATNKEYDGTTTATISAMGNGLVAGDVTSVNGTGAFDDKNVGTSKTITVTGLNISSTDAGNYLLDSTTGTTSANITKKNLTVSGITVTDKTYDGNTTATTDFASAVFSGLVSGDTLAVTTVTGTFDNKNVGTNKTVTLSSSSYNGADVGNYNITDQASSLANITKKDLTVSGITVTDKTYDGNPTATTDFTSAVFSGLVSGDTLAVTTVTGTFDNKNVGTNKTVTLSSSSYNGADVGNYNITDQASSLANITKKDLTVSGITANGKTYDGNPTATTDFTSAVFSGLVSGDALAVATVTGTFDNKNVGTNKTVTLSSSSYNGADVGNYNITDQASSLANITKKDLTVSGITANGKTYDGNPTATVNTASIDYAGLVSGDLLSLDTSSGAFDNKNVSNSKTVTLTNTYTGADVANYSFTDQTSTTAAITAATLTLSGTTGLGKVYDGTTALSAGNTGYGTLSGLIGSDDVTLTGSPVYSSATVGAQTIQQGTIGLQGLESGNYSLTWTDGNGDITAAPLTVRANHSAKFITELDPASFHGVSIEGLVNGETTSVLGGTAAITRSDSGNQTVGTHSGVLVPSGLTATNYTLSFVNGDFTIVPANQLLVEVDSTPMSTFGTTPIFTVNSAKYLKTDETTIIDLTTSVSANDNAITVTDGVDGNAAFTLAALNPQTSTGGHLEVGSYEVGSGSITETSINFSDTVTFVGTHTVVPKSLTVANNAVSKTYDRTTAITDLTLGLTGLASDDVATVTGTGTYDSTQVGTGLSYTLNNLALAGTDADNYFLTGGSSVSKTNGVITAKNLTRQDLMATNRVYNGGTAATLANGGTLVGVVAGDTVTSDTSGATAVFDNKNVGTNKTVTVTGLGLNGAQASNYTVNATDHTTAAITRLAAVTWTGGATGNWFDPANWAGGAVPDLANVAAVTIPTGVVVTFNESSVVAPAEAGTVAITRLGTAGGLAIEQGTLAVGTGGVTLDTLEQTGGTLTSVGDLTLGQFTQTSGATSTQGQFTTTEGYDQSGTGTVTVGGTTTLTDTSGGLRLGNLSSTGPLVVTSTDGAITQTPNTGLTASSTSHFTAQVGGQPADIRLTNTGNDFLGLVHLTGRNVNIVDGNGGLQVGTVTATGALTLTGVDRVSSELDTSVVNTVGGITSQTEVNVIPPVGSPASLPVASQEVLTATANSDSLLPNADPTLVSLANPASSSIIIREVSQATPHKPGLIMISLPLHKLQANKELVLAMPESVRETLDSYTSTFTLIDGQPLPAWIVYEAEAGQFRLTNPPPQVFPLEIFIKDGIRKLKVVFSKYED